MTNPVVQSFVENTFEEYLSEADWRTKENSNAVYSFGSLNKYVLGKVSALYWEKFYNAVDPRIMSGHRNGDYHIHDLGSYSSYCFGASLRDLLTLGIQGVDNVCVSSPARRLRSACSQIANIVTIFQNEVAGAVAFSSWNVYLAPFVYFDKLRRDGLAPNGTKLDLEYSAADMDDISQSVENMIYALNSNSRMGSEPAFSNLTLDFEVLEPMKNQAVIVAGNTLQEYTYSMFQKEADLLLKVFARSMHRGDAQGRPFAYPIPTFNVGKKMDWNGYDEVFELAAKTGAPYFGNFLHGVLKESDVYSMCCRLRLDKRELLNKAGGLFGAAEKTGSLGVFTINLPSVAFRTKGKGKEAFFNDLREQMELGYLQLITKREIIDREFKRGLFPALKTYLGRLDTLFLTIGFVGGNEMCRNALGVGIESEQGRDFAIEVLNFMRGVLSDFQEKSGFLFNLEYTPAESAAYRLALKDKQRYPEIITAGECEPYYTNSTHLPVGLNWSYQKIYEHQHGLLSLATGGSVYHNYMREPTTAAAVKRFLQGAFTKYDLPYISFSPVYSVCDQHGFLPGEQTTCPQCHAETTVFQRVTGYVRPVKNFNKGKKEEYRDRFQNDVASLGV
jgi:anaerobic ribonucleoside-triphosphate reductase